MWRIHKPRQNQKEPDSEERFVLPAALKVLSQICRCEIAFARNIPRRSAASWTGKAFRLKLAFGNCSKNDEDAPIAVLNSVMMIRAIAMELILRLLRRF